MSSGLSLFLLGPFQAELDGTPLTGLRLRTARALLAYLAVEHDRAHGREKLASLLWSDSPTSSSLASLRNTLSVLRKAIDDRPEAEPILLATREDIRFNPAADCWLDLQAFLTGLADTADVNSLCQAVDISRGDFMEGFSLPGSPLFDEWLLSQRENLYLRYMAALKQIAALYEAQGQLEKSVAYVRRQLLREPWREESHRHLMRLLAASGRRSEALAQYETCRRLLAEELGVEPGDETARLYENIRDGKLKVSEPTPATLPDRGVSLPGFLEGEALQVELPVFVARERELAQLEGFLDRALAGQGRVAFVTGEAGSGKTALLHEFARRAQDAQAELLVAGGNCNAYTGIGDPYLPFREILELLTGDVEAKWAAGAISREHALRLWQTLPHAAQAVVEAGPDLIDTFLPRAALSERAMKYGHSRDKGDWLPPLAELLEHKPPTSAGTLSLQQSDLFEQYTRVLQSLAQRRRLLLMVDDLQWADLGSISLLFHLGRHLAGNHILIVGAYRPEEIALPRDGQRHPLEPVVNELQRNFGDNAVDLGQAEGRDFVEAILDSEPNRLGSAFREKLYRQTRGHPLFTIELLRGLREQGDLVRDHKGRWAEGPALDWDTLPARVEAVVAERIGRLSQPLRAALRVASVEGEVFTAEVVARVQGEGGREMVGRLSSELDRKHRLVRAQAVEHLGSQRVSLYRFRHFLVQKYLYDNMDEVERAYLHEDVGRVLEGLYGDQASEIAVQLARHFQEAGLAEREIHYLRQAGERAVQLSAYQEALAPLTRGLELLMTLPDSPERAEQELALQLALGMARIREIPSPEWENSITRARELCRQIGKTSELCRTLGELAISHYVRAEYQKAREFGEEALSLAQQAGDPLIEAVDHWHLGFILFGLGEYITARSHLEQVISFYEPQQHHHAFVLLRGSDAGVSALAYDACCQWCLGYPEQALQRSREALALARKQDHPFTLADVLCFAGCLFNAMHQDAQALKDFAEELMQLSREIGFLSFEGTGIRYRGEALTRLGRVQEGMAQMREGMAVRQSIRARCHLAGISGALAKAQGKAGQPGKGLATLDKTLALLEETDERHWEAELYRLKGELLRAQGFEAEAEASFYKAIEVARRQQARSWELRATVGLCRLWQAQGAQVRIAQARQMLAEVYDWFTEGFDTADLIEARMLLEELS
ncbi:MAG: BTAD domain-containing putative transcriptional regulator [Chloroflexota bacterium]|nr:BTAD domain-containing putative transcriptional regulator [Chloroflexota bacterium]